MKFDYWHLDRYLDLAGTTDDDVLPFVAGEMVMGNVVCMREPVWRTAVATARHYGVPDIFDTWNRDRLLSPAIAARTLPAVGAAIDRLDETSVVFFPDELVEDILPSESAVRDALRALRELFKLAVDRNVAVETWAN